MRQIIIIFQTDAGKCTFITGLPKSVKVFINTDSFVVIAVKKTSRLCADKINKDCTPGILGAFDLAVEEGGL